MSSERHEGSGAVYYVFCISLVTFSKNLSSRIESYLPASPVAW